VTEKFKNIYKGKTVLVTGDTGFKGSWLSIWLISLGAKVIGYALPAKNAQDNYNVCGLWNKIVHYDADIRDRKLLDRIIKKHRPDIVFHLAAQPLVLDSYADPHYTYETNVMGTVNVLECVRHSPFVKAAVCVTSDKCYRNDEKAAGYKETDPLGGNDPYSASKGAAEIVVQSYISSYFSEKGSANIASARAGNVIGGGDWSENRIFPDCIRALNKNKPIMVRNPDAVRPWQHVLEPIFGYLLLGSLLYAGGKAYTGPWNFGPLPDHAVSVKKLVELIIECWGSGSYRAQSKKNKTPESRSLRLDVSKAVKSMGWLPVFDISRAVQVTIEEYRCADRTVDGNFSQRLEHIADYVAARRMLTRQ